MPVPSADASVYEDGDASPARASEGRANGTPVITAQPCMRQFDSSQFAENSECCSSVLSAVRGKQDRRVEEYRDTDWYNLGR